VADRAAAGPADPAVDPRGGAPAPPGQGRHPDHGRAAHRRQLRAHDPALGRPANLYLWTVLATTLSFAAIGFTDDWLKVQPAPQPRPHHAPEVPAPGRGRPRRRAHGAGGRRRRRTPAPSRCPSSRRCCCRSGFLYMPFVALVLLGSSNAVNLTDGLDGLAVGAVAHRRVDLHDLRLPRGPLPHRRVPPIPAVSGRRGRGVHRCDGRGLARLPVVQLPPGPGLHGRRRLARPRRRRSGHRGDRQAGAAAGDRRRAVRRSRRCRSSSRSDRSSCAASGSSGCRPCTTTSSSWAGPRPRW
jgi:hypothetical protein